VRLSMHAAGVPVSVRALDDGVQLGRADYPGTL
jgi:hypothetical protein